MKIVIIGGKGTSMVIADQIYDAKIRYSVDVEVIGLALDDRSMGDYICDYPILCDIKDLHNKYEKYDDVKYIYALHRPDRIRERTKLLYDLNIPLEKFCNFIHPSVMMAHTAKIGYGNVILANCVVNHGVTMGNFNTINSGVLIGHDTVLGDNNFIAGHVVTSSAITIGNMNFIGLNSAVHRSVGNGNLIGQCSNAIKEIGNDMTLFGNPAIPRGGVEKKPDGYKY
jgi:acetyltransferase-like isoleucine patch superfamily enzyme